MFFPAYRPRRMRRNENLRRLIRETKLSVDDLVHPLFVVPGKGVKKPIQSMPGNFQMSVDHLLKEVKQSRDLAPVAFSSFSSGMPKSRTRTPRAPFGRTGSSSGPSRRSRTRCPTSS